MNKLVIALLLCALSVVLSVPAYWALNKGESVRAIFLLVDPISTPLAISDFVLLSVSQLN